MEPGTDGATLIEKPGFKMISTDGAPKLLYLISRSKVPYFLEFRLSRPNFVFRAELRLRGRISSSGPNFVFAAEFRTYCSLCAIMSPGMSVAKGAECDRVLGFGQDQQDHPLGSRKAGPQGRKLRCRLSRRFASSPAPWVAAAM